MKTAKRLLSAILTLSMFTTLFSVSAVSNVSADDGLNIALLGTAFDDGSDVLYDGEFISLDGVNDGNTVTAWQYATAGEDEDVILTWPDGIFVGITFDKTYVIDNTYILVEEASRYNYDAMVVEYTADNVTWQEVPNAFYSYGYNSGTYGWSYDQVTFDAVKAAAIRIVMYEGVSKWCPQIAEINVYEAGDTYKPYITWVPNVNNIAVNGQAFDDGSDVLYAEDAFVSLNGLNDGDYITSWQYATQGDLESEEILSWPYGIYAGVTLDQVSVISDVMILIEDGARYAPDTDSMVVQYSPDSINWFDVPNATYTYYIDSGISGWSYDSVSFDAVEAAAVRIVMYHAINKWSPKIAELEVYEAPEGTEPTPPDIGTWEPNDFNIAILGDAFDDGSDSYYGGNVASLEGINDGEILTRWQYATSGKDEYDILYWPDGIYAGVILDDFHVIDTVAVLVEASSRYTASPSGMVIEYTDDFLTWQEVPNCEYSYDIPSGFNGWVYDIATFDAVEAVAVRIVMYEATTKWSPSIAEFEVYEADTEPSLPPIFGDVTLTLTEESTYTLDEEGLYVLDVRADTTVAEVKSNFVEDIQLTDLDGNAYADDALVGTGMWIQVLSDGEYMDTLYETVIDGDVTGDGKINSTDFMQIRKNFLEVYEFEMYSQWLAADTNEDEEVNSTDFMRVRRHFLGSFDIFE